MRIISRYILKEHIGPFVFSMCVITLFFILNLIFRDLSRILSKGLSIATILEFFFLQLAWIIALAGPMSVLVATVMAFGRLSGDQEITALKAGGVSVLSMIKPVLIAATLLAAGMIWFNNHVLPDFNHRARLLTADIYRKKPTINIEAGVIYRDLRDVTLRVQNIVQSADTAFVDSVFIDDNSNPNSSKIIFAKRGTIYFDNQAELLLLTLYDGEMHELDLQKMEQYRKLLFPKQIISISVPGMALERSDSEARGDREKSASMMLIEIKENNREIFKYEEQLKTQTEEHFRRYVHLLKPVPNASTKPRSDVAVVQVNGRWTLERLLSDHLRMQQQIAGELSTIKHLQRHNGSLMVEVHKKYSIPVACLIFVLVGAPLGIMARRGSLAMAGGISFAFFLLYWAALIGGEELADKQIISPFAAMWTANIVVGIAGIYMVFHSTHEATSLNWASLKNTIRNLLTRPSL
jgi:lipopolysaccharide export system permease protein